MRVTQIDSKIRKMESAVWFRSTYYSNSSVVAIVNAAMARDDKGLGARHIATVSDGAAAVIQ